MRIDAIGHDGNKDNYFGVIEEVCELDYGPLMIPMFRCQWVNRVGGGVTERAYRPLVGFGVLIDNTIKGLTCLHAIMSSNLIKKLVLNKMTHVLQASVIIPLA